MLSVRLVIAMAWLDHTLDRQGLDQGKPGSHQPHPESTGQKGKPGIAHVELTTSPFRVDCIVNTPSVRQPRTMAVG